MNRSFKTTEKARQYLFAGGIRETFHNVTSVDSKGGDYIRLQCDEGFVLINPKHVLCIVVQGTKDKQ